MTPTIRLPLRRGKPFDQRLPGGERLEDGGSRPQGDPIGELRPWRGESYHQSGLDLHAGGGRLWVEAALSGALRLFLRLCPLGAAVLVVPDEAGRGEGHFREWPELPKRQIRPDPLEERIKANRGHAALHYLLVCGGFDPAVVPPPARHRQLDLNGQLEPAIGDPRDPLRGDRVVDGLVLNEPSADGAAVEPFELAADAASGLGVLNRKAG